MNNYCKKLDIKLPTIKTHYVEDLPHLETYKAPQPGAFKYWKTERFFPIGNDIYDIDPEDNSLIEQLIPRELLAIEMPKCRILKIDPNNVIWQAMDLLSKKTKDPGEDAKIYMLPPHIDKVRKCGLNFYLSTHGEETKFFKYENDDIVEDYSFVSKDGECWLLNVDVPHSVTMVPPHVRIIFSISFSYTPYEEVVKFF